MENIIQQIVKEAVKKFLEYYGERGLGNLSAMAKDFKLMSDEMAKKMLQAFITFADKAIREEKSERMGDGIRIRESAVPREIFTALGPFSYERTYYDMPRGRRYILDHILGVAAYERIDAGVSAELANKAAVHSYARSAGIVTGGRISRQSVRNKAMNTGEVAYVPDRAPKTPETLHIFADEAHVNLQNGRNTILPLVTVSGGKRPVFTGRNELIDPFHVHGYGMKPEEHWEYVYALCAEKYDMGLVKNVYVYGDGAAWIKRCFDVFPGAVYILDEFHFKKRARSLLAGEICSVFSLSIHDSIARNDKSLFDRTVQKMIGAIEEKTPEGREREKKIKSVKEHGGYILTHWNAIQNRKLPGVIGSCTEALISHALAERFTRDPMGWSAEGLSKMVMIRVFILNGGKIEPADTLAWKHSDKRHSVITKLEKYEAIIRKQQEQIFKEVKRCRWFEVDDLISGKRTGTSVALDALGRTRNIS